MKTKEEIQKRMQKLEKQYVELNESFDNHKSFSEGADISKALDTIEAEIDLLKWVLN